MFAVFVILSNILNLKCCMIWNTSWYSIAFVTVNKKVTDADQVSVPAFVSFPDPSLRILDNLTGRERSLWKTDTGFLVLLWIPVKKEDLNIHLHNSCTSHSYLYLTCIVFTTSQFQLIPYTPQIGEITQITYIISSVLYITVIYGPKSYNCGHCLGTESWWFLPAKVTYDCIQI